MSSCFLRGYFPDPLRFKRFPLYPEFPLIRLIKGGQGQTLDRNLDCPPNEAKNSRLKFPHGQNSTAESYCEGLTFILTLWPSNRVPASEAKRQFVSPIKRSNAGRNPPRNPADTTTVEIGLVTSLRCQRNIHRVNERNLSTRTLVGTLGPW